VRSGWRACILELSLQQMSNFQKVRARQSAGQGIGELGVAPVERLLGGRFSKSETWIAFAAASQIERQALTVAVFLHQLCRWFGGRGEEPPADQRQTHDTQVGDSKRTTQPIGQPSGQMALVLGPDLDRVRDLDNEGAMCGEGFGHKARHRLRGCVGAQDPTCRTAYHQRHRN
jgi:hypothetical protein